MFKGTRVRVPARKIIMGFNTTTEATGIRLSSFAVGTSKSKPEQTEGGGKKREDFGHKSKKSVYTRI